MDYILSGDPRVIEDVLKESKIRVQKGWITFTPCTPERETDDKYLPEETDTKELRKADKKRTRKQK